jgi:hypothetical protein
MVGGDRVDGIAEADIHPLRGVGAGAVKQHDGEWRHTGRRTAVIEATHAPAGVLDLETADRPRSGTDTRRQARTRGNAEQSTARRARLHTTIVSRTRSALGQPAFNAR